MKHLFILNPVAGGKKAHADKVSREIGDFAGSLSEPYEVYITKFPMDACAKVAAEAKNEEALRVYACGGDGTLNECVNGAAKLDNVAVTQYPCGTGNDFIRTFGKENIAKFHDLQALTNGTARSVDLINCRGRYGINICSVGLDARVGADVHKYSKIPVIGGATGYVVALAVNVIKGVAQRFRIVYGDVAFDKEITLACACNGRFYGGGFNPLPAAMPDDGVIEYLIIDKVSRFKIAQIVGKYAKGEARDLDQIVTYVRGGPMEFESGREFVVNIDGEIIATTKICFEVIPKGVNFIFPVGLDFSGSHSQHSNDI